MTSGERRLLPALAVGEALLFFAAGATTATDSAPRVLQLGLLVVIACLIVFRTPIREVGEGGTLRRPLVLVCASAVAVIAYMAGRLVFA